jgi:methionyl aminopeptidase
MYFHIYVVFKKFFNGKIYMEIKEIAKKVKEKVKKEVKLGKRLIDIAEEIEKYIYELNAVPAFPLNISINEVAAHYTPSFDDNKELNEGLVKIDFGIYKDGLISDNAITIDFTGKYESLVECAEKALEKAIEEIKPGKTIKEISREIEKVIKEKNLKPISNLSGHKIEGKLLHAGITLPNVSVNENYVLKEGDVFAIEPFVTTKEAAGFVIDKDEVEIYSYIRHAPLRLREGNILLDYIKEKYDILPFAERWVYKKVNNKLLLHAILKEMLSKKCIKAYPVLEEKSKNVVAQAEKTVQVTKDGCEPLISE